MMRSPATIRAFSFGGGVQSTAALVLAAQGHLDYPLFLFANVGDDSEHPATLRYVRDVAMPYAASHGLELVEVRRLTADGTPETLWQLLQRDRRSIAIPVRMPSGYPGTRQCTWSFKIAVIVKELRRRGATLERPATVGVGISLDEFHRMRTTSPSRFYTVEYPLIDRRIDRREAQNIIRRAGLPVPPKSSCWFCPFHSRAYWQQLRREHPDLFAKSVALERLLNQRRAAQGKYPVWLSGFGKPLDEAIQDDGQLSLDLADGSCDSAGYCMV